MKNKDLLCVMRALAILSVICAHVSLITRGGNLGDYTMHVLANFGTIGVGIFYLISGYNFRPKSFKFSESVRLKCVSIVLPWICVGTLVWLYVVLRKGGISLVGWLKFITGYGSYLYFLTDLVVFYLVFYLINRIENEHIQQIVYLTLIPVSYLAIVLEYNNISVFPNFYLDSFIFIGYFSVGYLIREYNRTAECRILKNPVWMLSFILPFMPMLALSYAGDMFVPIYETAFIIGTFSLSRLLMRSGLKNGLIWIGKQSMALYLLHMPFAGIIANIFNRLSWGVYIDFLRPFLTLAITTIAIKLVIFVSHRLNTAWLMKMMGIRNI